MDATKCTGCGLCAQYCPVNAIDSFNQGLSDRSAIYIDYPQAVPLTFLIDRDQCIGCGLCDNICLAHAINYSDTEQSSSLHVGAIILAPGAESIDAKAIGNYGYQTFPNVVTSMEFERLISTGGPLQGHFGRPSDQKKPQRVAFIQCVGSRTRDPAKGNPYCSNICCMNTIKSTQYLKDNYPEIDITVFYMDLRAFGKGFEELLMRSKTSGVRYVRGVPGDVTEISETGNLKVIVENTTARRLENHEFDMVVLAVGAKPATDTESIRRLVSQLF